LIASFGPLQSLSISESPTEIKMFQIRGFTCGMWVVAKTSRKKNPPKSNDKKRLI